MENSASEIKPLTSSERMNLLFELNEILTTELSKRGLQSQGGGTVLMGNPVRDCEFRSKDRHFNVVMEVFNIYDEDDDEDFFVQEVKNEFTNSL